MSDWTERPEGGGWLAIRLIRGVARHGGRGVARLLLLPISLYFLLVRGPERRASRAFLSRVHGRRARLHEVARHVHAFASTILDRVFLLEAGSAPFDIRIDGLEVLDRQLARGRGALMFGSHLGSFEVLRVLAARRPEIRLRVVLDTGHNPAMTRLLDELNPDIASTVIDAGQDGPSIVLAIREATEQGHLVALLVDRTYPGQPSLPATFLGARAQFPAAPWLIASVLAVPVVLGFGLYRGGNRYDLSFELFSEGIAIARKDRPRVLAELVQRYAARLQHHVRRAPYNWFNFYDFWQSDDASDPSHDPAAGPAAGDAFARRGGA